MTDSATAARDPNVIDHECISRGERVGELRGPQVLKCNQQCRAVVLQVFADLLSVILAKGSWLRDLDAHEAWSGRFGEIGHLY